MISIRRQPKGVPIIHVDVHRVPIRFRFKEEAEQQAGNEAPYVKKTSCNYEKKGCSRLDSSEKTYQHEVQYEQRYEQVKQSHHENHLKLLYQPDHYCTIDQVESTLQTIMLNRSKLC